MTATRVVRAAELALPGFAVGLVAGVTAGALALIVGQPVAWAVTTALTLGLPLGLFGGGYGLLIVHGRVRIGGFAPVALYWLAAFPAARLVHEILTRLVLTGHAGLPDDPLGFVAYQGIISAGFAIGFLWLHERIAPRWWHRVAARNPRAEHVCARYAAHAQQLRTARRTSGRRR
ncbi:hypothetical protein [Amycolatopsis anabasis]|uniref:hypothetical protein n=1 Tax=Amycolatopsis anabasis TaxID=1840409 RepID=UPI00131E4ACC|nr:hypothetical protein [Amycolatopsis anabasis]